VCYIQSARVGYTVGTGAGEGTVVISFLEISHLDGWVDGWSFEMEVVGKKAQEANKERVL
jgi:hypothetical protein